MGLDFARREGCALKRKKGNKIGDTNVEEYESSKRRYAIPFFNIGIKNWAF